MLNRRLHKAGGFFALSIKESSPRGLLSFG